MKKKKLIYFAIPLFVTACNLRSESNVKSDNHDPTKTYKLQVKPVPGSNYHYDVINETEMSLEVDEKKIKNINKSDIGINYKISKDSLDDLLFTLQFDRIHIYTKNNDKIKEMDANSGAMSIDPVEKMLAILKETTLQSTISPTGETKIITGFKEIGDKIIAAFPGTDENTKLGIRSQLNKTIGEALVKKNMDQQFKIFPDSPVHIGDTWKLATKEEGEISYAITNIFTLKAINNDIAIIESHGTVTTENVTSNIAGLNNNAVSDLKGEQEGEYEMETKTGMIINSRIKANVTGTIHVMSRTIPIKIKSSVKMNGQKVGS
jgi:hypothetical protein